MHVPCAFCTLHEYPVVSELHAPDLVQLTKKALFARLKKARNMPYRKLCVFPDSTEYAYPRYVLVWHTVSAKTASSIE